MTDKPVIQSVQERSKVLYQCVKDSVPEPALIITPYKDVISIEQEDRYINLNYETVAAFVKLLKEMQP